MALNPSPAASPMATSSTCPKCGAAVAAGSRFCNRCGSSMAPRPAAAGAAGSPPVDLRERVDQDRGVLKRLQLLIPGFRGYRQGEDDRAADNLLRIQTADKIRNARATMENVRTSLTNAGQFSALTDLAPLLSDLQRLEGEIRAAEQGYTGISPSVRINPQQLDRLYEYDYGFVVAADQVNQTVSELPASALATGPSGVPGILARARSQVSQLEQAWKARLQAVEGTRVS
ncbi:MAG: zinc ribbon domain-containing protein [Thermoplasmata archaeon]